MEKNKEVHIAFDLELEQPKTNSQTPDSKLDKERIIQIGWCVFSCDPFEIVATKEYNINVGVPLSAFIKNLTGISDADIKNGVSLLFAYSELYSDIQNFKASRVLKQWGGGDQDCLRAELPVNLEWAFGRSAYNVKHLYQTFAEARGLNRSGGLKKSMRRCNLSFEGRAHGALADAINTARFYNYLMTEFKHGKNGNS